MNICPQCGAPVKRKWCGQACSSKWNREHETRICAHSGCDSRVRARGLCSTHYNQITNHLTSDPSIRQGDGARRRERDLINAKRRRALTRGAHVENIDRQAIFNRDGWICWLCQRPVDKREQWPSVMCPSIDHVIPLSQGGEHTSANIRLAHFRCNVRRGTKTVTTQLALVG